MFNGANVKVQATLFPFNKQTKASVKALLGVVQIPPFQGWLLSMTLILDEVTADAEGVNFIKNYPTYYTTGMS